jgi:L-ascorbate metabolism protein UlaG (beta-lactamase superfamily)
MARDDLELSLRRTGGLAGLPMVASLNTRDLDPEAAERIVDALDQADLDHVHNRPDAPPGSADMFQYQLDVRGPDRTQTVRFSDHQMPPELAPVIRALMRGAKPGR